MNEIPWGWQLAVSFAVPIISALGAYFVALQTFKRSEISRNEDRSWEKEKWEREIEERKKTRQREAVVTSIENISKYRSDLTVGQLKYKGELNRGNIDSGIKLGAIVIDFYKNMYDECAVLAIEVTHEKIVECVDCLRDEMDEGWLKIEEARKTGYYEKWMLVAAEGQPLTESFGKQVTRLVVYSGNYLN